MVRASLYITVCSAKNRARVRLRRLREPRYLLGAIVGVAYFYFGFFAPRRSRANAARRARGAAAIPAGIAALVAAGPAFAGLALLLVTTLAWIVPAGSNLLEFSDAEIQMLFPAPVSRRALLIHRIVRSQIGLFFTSVVVAIVTPTVAGYTRLRLTIAMWVVLVTLRIAFAGITLARARLASANVRARRVAWMPAMVLAGAVAVVIGSLAGAFSTASPHSVIDALTTIADVADHGPARFVLFPFVTVVRPVFAAWPHQYLSTLGAATLILVGATAWLLRSDRAFHEAAAASAERRAIEPAARNVRYRVRASGWSLSPTGRAETALAWKAATQTFRIVDRRTIARGVAVLLSLSVAAVSLSRARGVPGVIGALATFGAGAALLFFPQVVRIDIRQDLQHLEMLKTWPVGAAVVVRGEMLWPGLLITVCAWVLQIVALLMSSAVFTRVSLAGRLSTAIALAIVAPALVFAQLTIHNGVALMFPGWVALGNQRARGLDAMGQRLIMLGGTWFLLVLMTLPGAIAGFILWFGFSRFIGIGALIPAAIVCSVTMAIEILLASEALGPAFDRLDLTAVERVE